jgi:hypothetical protein
VNDYGVSSGEAVIINVKANDFDADGDLLSVATELPPDYGTVELQADGSILYTPGEDYFGFDSFTYRVSDPAGDSSAGTVTIQDTEPDSLVQPGSYLGLMVDESGNEIPRGQFSLKVVTGGRFSGAIVSQKKRIPFRGTFGAAGTAVVNVNVRDQGSRVLFLAFKSGFPNSVIGVFYGEELWNGEAGLATPSGSRKKKSYTIQIESLYEVGSELPGGYGYGIMTMKPTGTVSMVGRLGDGSKMSWGSRLTTLPELWQTIPVYSEPLPGGLCAGQIFTEVDSPDEFDFAGNVNWIRPPALSSSLPYAFGFNGRANVRIAEFVPPGPSEPAIAISDGLVVLSFGMVESYFEIDSRRITCFDSLFRLAINRRNGLFSGTMLVGQDRLPFKGAVNQRLRDGAGYLMIDGESLSVELYSPEGDF